MRMCLDAISKTNTGYTPDWISFTYEDNNNTYDICFDIQGDIDYKSTRLSCRVKGDLIPWVLREVDTGKEINLYDMEEAEAEAMFPIEKIIDIFKRGHDFVVGIYPTDDENWCGDYDDVTDGEGYIDICDFSMCLNFKTEINV